MQQYVPWLISAGSLLVAILSFVRTGARDERADEREDGEQMASIKESLLKANLKLDQLCQTTTETRSDIKILNRDMQAIETRVAVLERDLKTAFSQIEEIKKG